VCLCVCLCVCVCVCVCMCVREIEGECLFLCMCVFVCVTMTFWKVYHCDFSETVLVGIGFVKVATGTDSHHLSKSQKFSESY